MADTIPSLLQRIYEAEKPDPSDIESLLAVQDEGGMAEIFNFADRVRRQCVGEGILVRGIVAFSNNCRNACAYCGLQRKNKDLQRYRLTGRQILEAVAVLVSAGIKTVVLQSAEDPGLQYEWLAEVISGIKASFDVAVTLSVGERDAHEYRRWREAGADRYLLKMETTHKGLYESLHPGMSFENRIECLRTLYALGYQTGSGTIIGLPGQTARMIADDIVFFKQSHFDMIGIGPLVPHSCTQLAGVFGGDTGLTLKALALTRIVAGYTHLPATTALGVIEGPQGRKEAFCAGANVIMFDFTPMPYRQWYELYPGRNHEEEPVCAGLRSLESLARSLRRRIDYSKGALQTISV